MWDKIKKILQKEGGKCIIVEDNQPTYLVMKLEDYEKISDSHQSAESEIEKVNRDIDKWRANQKDNEQTENTETEEIKIEDLPF